MIEKINLKHFKCFETIHLNLSRLTLLSGTNASGKSTILQALVLLHQTMREHEWSTRLMLNGSILELGTVQDVVDQVYGRNSFDLNLHTKEHVLSWRFSGERADMSMALDRVTIDRSSFTSPSRLQYLLPTDQGATIDRLAGKLRNLTYVTAERIGPQAFYPMEERQKTRVVGPKGEHAISLLYMGMDQPVLEGLRMVDVSPLRLQQVEARMADFFPGFGMALDKVPRVNAVTLGLRTSNDTDYHRPANVGFGLTQVLPIVIAALSAERDDLLLIENPEVHLHPAGQMQMGQFLAEVANAGVQVIVETHSDHVLNGIRRAVRKKRITSDQVALHFFRPRSKNETQFFKPLLDERGNIDDWPEGFFDQFDKDMNFLAGWGE